MKVNEMKTWIKSHKKEILIGCAIGAAGIAGGVYIGRTLSKCAVTNKGVKLINEVYIPYESLTSTGLSDMIPLDKGDLFHLYFHNLKLSDLGDFGTKFAGNIPDPLMDVTIAIFPGAGQRVDL